METERPLYSIRRAAEILGWDRKVVRGAALALGIELARCGNSLAMDAGQLERIRRALGTPEGVGADR